MLAFPKELGDYVNELVPAPEEGAQAADSQVVGKVLGASPGADEKKERGSSLAASRSVVDDERGSREAREALDTVTFGTERVPTGLQPELSVTPSAVISAEDASGPMRRGNISGVDERAVLSHEGLTPAPIERARRRRAAADDHGRGRGSREEDDLADEGQTIRDGDLPRDAGGRLSFSRGAPRRDISLVDARGGGRLSSGREGFSGLFVGLFGVLLMLGVGVAVYFAVSDRTAPPAGTGTAAGGRSSLVADGGGGRASTRAIAGTLDVDANPMSATVFIDGAQRCDGKTRCRIEALPLGTLLVTVKAPGYRIWNQRVVLTPTKATLTLRPVLTREGVSGALEAPDGRSVTKDGGSSKPSSAGSGGKRPSKRHGTARPEKHPGKRRSAHGGKGAPAIPGVVPQKGKGRLIRGKIAGKMAMIVVDVRPAWAEVWVDGKMLGPTPILRPIKPGRHRVDLRNPKMKFHVYYRLKVKAGDKIKIADTISPKH
ncbi:MAG: PEGA domain-containing protein [Deltaproteobacteria bacterium]|nr:PEGA domain-containing protein [Deltaproteobacteria bacterium]